MLQNGVSPWVSFIQDLEGSFFSVFMEHKLITLSKMTQNLKIRASFMHNFIELDLKKIVDPKAVPFRVWSLKQPFLVQFREIYRKLDPKDLLLYIF